jgi:hypothetical protein
VGHGRRLHPGGLRHPVRAARRPDLLGELHAAGPLRPVRQGDRRLGGADLGQQRRVGADPAAHRQGGPGPRGRRGAAAARLRRPRRPPRPRRAVRRRGGLAEPRPVDHRGPARGDPGRSAGGAGGHPLRRARPGPRPRRPDRVRPGGALRPPGRLPAGGRRAPAGPGRHRARRTGRRAGRGADSPGGQP